jgi:type IV fimbrial biogenesis protein FimT
MLTSLAIRHRGMSLIELLVAMTVLGMTLLVGLPSFSQAIRNSQIRATGEALLTGLAKARNEALRRNSRVRFSLVDTPEGNTCALSRTSGSWIVSLQDPNANCQQPVSETVAPMILSRWNQREASLNVTVSVMNATCAETADTKQVVFDGFGRVNATAADPIRCIVLNHNSGSGNRALRITVSAAGAARMCDPAVTDTKDPRRC